MCVTQENNTGVGIRYLYINNPFFPAGICDDSQGNGITFAVGIVRREKSNSRSAGASLILEIKIKVYGWWDILMGRSSYIKKKKQQQPSVCIKSLVKTKFQLIFFFFPLKN